MTVTIVLRGPFTDEDKRRLVAVMQQIEATRPDETFEVLIDAPEEQGTVDELLDKINPPRPGYTRTLSYWDNPKPERGR